MTEMNPAATSPARAADPPAQGGIDAFFTPASLFTFGGATAAVYTVSNVAKVQFVLDPVTTSYLALALAVIICIVGAVSMHTTGSLARAIMIAIINGFLVFGTASGMTSTTHAVTGGSTQAPTATNRDASAEFGPAAAEPAPTFSTPWP